MTALAPPDLEAGWSAFPPPTVESAVPARRRTRWPIVIGGVALAGIIGTVIGFAVTGAGGDSALAAAAEHCNARSAIQTDGSLYLDTEGEEDSTGDDIVTVACVIEQLKVPDSVVNKIDHTRALDGTMSDEWDGYTATWNYHPDDGLMLVIEQS